MHCLGGRIILPELLDTLPEPQARASLNDLTRINAGWGGHSTLRKLLERHVRAADSFSLLDVGAASGDMAARVREWYPNSRVVLLDHIATHLAKAAGDRVAGDAFHLPIHDRAFDFVFCSLFLHHFSDDQVIELLRGFGRVAARAVLVIDLERHPIAYYFLPFTRWIFGWDPVTIHDGTISVEAAFKPRELESLAARAGLREPAARAYRPGFRVAMSAKAVSYNTDGG